MATAKTVSASSNPYMAAWQRTKARLDSMSKGERRQIFVNAGILTRKGKVGKPFKKVFVEASQAD
jgi:hypothetical protein